MQQSREVRLVDVHKQPLGREGPDLILDLVQKGARNADSDRSVQSESSSFWKSKRNKEQMR